MRVESESQFNWNEKYKDYKEWVTIWSLQGFNGTIFILAIAINYHLRKCDILFKTKEKRQVHGWEQ